MSADNKKSLPGVRRNPAAGGEGDVGYARPPRQHQFSPGQSGNPRGRPKGSKNESTILRDILQQKISVRGANGRVRKITVMEGLHRKAADRALQGDLKAAAFLLNRFAALVSGELQPQDMNDDDREVLEAFAQHTAARKASGELP